MGLLFTAGLVNRSSVLLEPSSSSSAINAVCGRNNACSLLHTPGDDQITAVLLSLLGDQLTPGVEEKSIFVERAALRANAISRVRRIFVAGSPERSKSVSRRVIYLARPHYALVNVTHALVHVGTAFSRRTQRRCAAVVEGECWERRGFWNTMPTFVAAGHRSESQSGFVAIGANFGQQNLRVPAVPGYSSKHLFRAYAAARSRRCRGHPVFKDIRADAFQHGIP